MDSFGESLAGGQVADREGFYRHCLGVGRKALSFDNPVIAHHYDADGISSGSIVCRAFINAGKAYSEETFRQLDERAIARLAGLGRPVIFVDFGSGQLLRVLSAGFQRDRIAIIDHHELDAPVQAREGVAEANCELFGLSGATEACAASTAYLCFRGQRDYLMQELAVVGFVGDMQDKAALSPTNAMVVADGVADGSVRVEKDLRTFGRVSRSLVSFLSFCTEPYLPGLTGNDKACALFIHDLGLPLFKDAVASEWTPAEADGSGADGVKRKWLHYYDLDSDQRRTLASALIAYAASHKVKPHAFARLVGDVYLFPREPANTELFDAYEHSTVLNACGRHGRESLGVAVCLREKGSVEQARSLVTLHRTQIRQGILYARRHAQDFGAFYFLDGRGHIEDSVVGIVCGAYLSSGLVDPSKPMIGLSFDPDGNAKISGRGTDALVARGLDLNSVLRESVGSKGFGGGHTVAAGAMLKKEFLPEAISEFLFAAKAAIERQLPRQ